MIRLAGAADAEEVAAIYDPVVAQTAISFEEEPPGAAGMERRIVEGSAFAPWLVDIGGNGRVDGYAYASRHRERAAYRWSVDVAVYVAAGRRGKGVGRALYTSLIALLRLQGFCAAHAGIALPNAASVALHERMGFAPIGIFPAVGYKLGAWRDVGWWRLDLREREVPPRPPRATARAREDPAWGPALSLGDATRYRS
ncbi:MAG TPA: arsinothricin resistance N-acetyltransferase ArsN1 family B [Myxococcales bacterium]